MQYRGDRTSRLIEEVPEQTTASKWQLAVRALSVNRRWAAAMATEVVVIAYLGGAAAS
jgi:hypothetical protein